MNCNSLRSALYGLLTILFREDIDLGKKVLDSLKMQFLKIWVQADCGNRKMYSSS